ncbi:VPLPA-CTERM sorting domain-containing protein [uncultured Roseobacter sp.]|uniref:VPLPA-CTERM sorting domain-containing protein n=1 Tax=uncultured Roseobacter sp. TaxID=114847 RepID=UPI00261176B2|nr:VPLPA-CTERM sorting domain-containing protein [uncultured Roseobacter sp.]
MKLIALAAAAALSLTTYATQAQAATLSGIFEVQVVNFNAGGSGKGARANRKNFDARFAAANDTHKDTFVYNGALDFFVDNFPRDLDLETISDFLGSLSSGTVSGLDAGVAGLRLSNPKFQTTTLFSFTEVYANAFDTSVTHDDGFTIYDDGEELIGFANPTGVRTTPKTGTINFTGGEFNLIYAAANGNPSKLFVEGDGVPAVPLPASALLLMGAMGGFGVAARHKARKAA